MSVPLSNYLHRPTEIILHWTRHVDCSLSQQWGTVLEVLTEDWCWQHARVCSAGLKQTRLHLSNELGSVRAIQKNWRVLKGKQLKWWEGLNPCHGRDSWRIWREESIKGDTVDILKVSLNTALWQTRWLCLPAHGQSQGWEPGWDRFQPKQSRAFSQHSQRNKQYLTSLYILKTVKLLHLHYFISSSWEP